MLVRRLDCGLRALGVPWTGLQWQSAVIERHQHQIRASAIDGRTGIKRLLHRLVERRLNDLQQNAVTDLTANQSGRDQFGCPVAEKAEPQFRQVGCGVSLTNASDRICESIKLDRI